MRAVATASAREETPELAVDRARLGLDGVRARRTTLGDLAEGQVGGKVAQQAQLRRAQRPPAADRRRIRFAPRLFEPAAQQRRLARLVQAAARVGELRAGGGDIVEQHERASDHRSGPRTRTRGSISFRASSRDWHGGCGRCRPGRLPKPRLDQGGDREDQRRRRLVGQRVDLD